MGQGLDVVGKQISAKNRAREGAWGVSGKGGGTRQLSGRVGNLEIELPEESGQDAGGPGCTAREGAGTALAPRRPPVATALGTTYLSEKKLFFFLSLF